MVAVISRIWCWNCRRNKGEVVRSAVDVAYDECSDILARYPQPSHNSTLQALVRDVFAVVRPLYDFRASTSEKWPHSISEKWQAVQLDVFTATPRDMRQVVAAASRCVNHAC
jgi:hypothetical protein